MARLPVEKVKIDLPITTENWWFSLLGFMFIGGLLLFTNWNRPTLSQPRLPTGFLCFYREDRFRGFSIAGDRLWAGGRDGLVLIDWKMGKVISLPSGTPDLKNIESVAVDSSGTIWVGYDSGLSAFQGGIWKDMSEGLPSPKVMSVFPTASGEVWVGTDKGTGRFVAGTWKPFEEQEKLSNSMVRVVFVDSRGGLWFGSYAAPAGGLSYFDGSEWHYYSTQNGLPHNNIVAVGEDRQGTIWVGSGYFDRGGLSRFNGFGSGTPEVKQFSKTDGLAGEKCRSVFQDRNGIWWFGSEYNGLARFNGRTWRTFTEDDGLSGNEVMTMAQDPSDNLWLNPCRKGSSSTGRANRRHARSSSTPACHHEASRSSRLFGEGLARHQPRSASDLI